MAGASLANAARTAAGVMPPTHVCAPRPAPRGLWWEVRRCPTQFETDAIQLETNELLDVADHQARPCTP